MLPYPGVLTKYLLALRQFANRSTFASGNITVINGEIIGIEKMAIESKMRLYLNPVINRLYVSLTLETQQVVQVGMVNYLGEIFYTGNLGSMLKGEK